MANHSSILAWRIPWTEEPGGLQSMGLQELDVTWQLKHKCVAAEPEKEAERAIPRRGGSRLQMLFIYFEKHACTKRAWKNVYHLGIERFLPPFLYFSKLFGVGRVLILGVGHVLILSL